MRRSRLSYLLVAALSLAYLLSYPLAIGRADESHLLYGARRILDGQVLYRDFFEGITPLAFYLFAGVYRVAGTSLLAARVTIGVVQAIGSVLLFHLVRSVAGTREAALAVLVFVVLCVPAWPYASAHWLSTTLGLAAAAVLLSSRGPGPSRVRPALAGMIAGIAICVQQQRGVFLAAWIPVALGVLGRVRPGLTRRRALVRELAWAAAGGVVVVGAVLGHAAWTASPASMVEMLFGFAVRQYAPAHSGRAAWAAVLPATQVWAGSTWVWLLRIAPLFLVVEGIHLLYRRRAWTPADGKRLCLVLLGVLMALSIAYLPDFIHVAFVLPFLLIPGLSALAAAGLGGSRLTAARGLVSAGIWILLAAVGAKAIANLTYARAIAPARFETAFGTLRADPDAERLFHAVRRHVTPGASGRALLYSYPDDAWLYLAVPADDATRFSVLVAGFFPNAYVEEVLAALRARRPDTVVLALPFTPAEVREAVEAGYDAVEEVSTYRIFVRRPSGLPAPAPGG